MNTLIKKLISSKIIVKCLFIGDFIWNIKWKQQMYMMENMNMMNSYR